MIILTPEQRDYIIAQTDMLDPRATLGGNYALPERVLDDPAHEALVPYLSGLPRGDVEWRPLPDSDEMPFDS